MEGNEGFFCLAFGLFCSAPTSRALLQAHQRGQETKQMTEACLADIFKFELRIAQIRSVMSLRLSLAAGFLRVNRAESGLHRHTDSAKA